MHCIACLVVVCLCLSLVASKHWLSPLVSEKVGAGVGDGVLVVAFEKELEKEMGCLEKKKRYVENGSGCMRGVSGVGGLSR